MRALRPPRAMAAAPECYDTCTSPGVFRVVFPVTASWTLYIFIALLSTRECQPTGFVSISVALLVVLLASLILYVLAMCRMCCFKPEPFDWPSPQSSPRAGRA